MPLSAITKRRTHFKNGLTNGNSVIKQAQRGLVVKRPRVLSKVLRLNFLLGVGSLPLLQNWVCKRPVFFRRLFVTCDVFARYLFVVLLWFFRESRLTLPQSLCTAVWPACGSRWQHLKQDSSSPQSFGFACSSASPATPCNASLSTLVALVRIRLGRLL